MTVKQKNEWSEPYLRDDLPAEEHERHAAELKANPDLLRELLQIKSPADEEQAAALLFNEFGAAEQNRLDERLRRYLLRDPAFEDEEIAQLEELMLDDERYFDRMMLVESELMEDYLRSALTADEKKRFKEFFLITPERREKLESIKALMADAALVKPLLKTEPASFSWRQSLAAFMRLPNLLAGAAAAVLLFVVIGALWWLSRSAERQGPLIVTVPENKSTRDPNQSNISNQPVNTPETGNVSPAKTTPQPAKSPPGNQGRKQAESPEPTPAAKPPVNVPRAVVFALVSGVSRSEGSAVEKKIEASTKAVELRLRLDLDRKYDDYRIAVQDSEGNEVGRGEKLKASRKDGLPTVVAALPAKSFKAGDYTVILSGGTKGAYQEAARYSFRVLK
ncbi:MAG TPA: hypothetical protein VF721_11860 [Pyrinomonadaceae bacterium]|jgi:hypothetical protein